MRVQPPLGRKGGKKGKGERRRRREGGREREREREQCARPLYYSVFEMLLFTHVRVHTFIKKKDL